MFHCSYYSAPWSLFSLVGTIYYFQSFLNLELRCSENHSSQINEQPNCYSQNIENLGKRKNPHIISLKSTVCLWCGPHPFKRLLGFCFQITHSLFPFDKSSRFLSQWDYSTWCTCITLVIPPNKVCFLIQLYYQQFRNIYKGCK